MRGCVVERRSLRLPSGRCSLFIRTTTLALVLGVLVQSCATISDKSVQMEQLGGTRFTSGELRIRAQEFGYTFSAAIEETADRIIASSGDSEVKRNALIWKMNAIPEIHRALSFEDPLVAGMDLLVLSMQMREFFSTGAGSRSFNDWQTLAISVTRELESSAMLLLDGFNNADTAAMMRRMTAKWVEENPITSLTFSRQSIVGLAAKTLGSKELDLTSTIGVLARGVSDIQRQITLYSGFLPKQARWQAEYLVLTAIDDSTRYTLLERLSRLDSAVIGVANTVRDGPDLLQTLRDDSFRAIDEQRTATLARLRDERVAIITALREERATLMSEIDRQRVATVAEARVAVDGTMHGLSSALVRAFDRILLRLMTLGVALFLLRAAMNRWRKKGAGERA